MKNYFFKARVFLQNITRIFIFISLFLLLFQGCKKEEIISKPIAAEKTSADKSVLFESDGIVTVETNILPPVTQQTFITNGNTSSASYQIVSSQHIVIEDAYFSAEYPLIQYAYSPHIGVAVNHASGQMGLVGIGEVDGNGFTMPMQIFYNAVDNSTSGSIARLNLTGLLYRTDDEVYHSFSPINVVPAQPMCLVNNIPHLVFQNPENDSINNGYKEIAEIKLSGDTDWTLNALPLNLWSPYLAHIPKSRLTVKSNGSKIATSDMIQLDANSRMQTAINFIGGFKHKAGKKEILRIFADAPEIGIGGNPIFINMYPLNSFAWTDGLGALMPGEKNVQFFKQNTGQSTFQQQ
ncbi:MAG: hypothetical protein ABI405_01160 [Parafilimonas sp.]